MADEDDHHQPCYDRYLKIGPYSVPEHRPTHAQFFSGQRGSGCDLLAECIQMAAQDAYRNYVKKKGFYHNDTVKEDVIASVISSVFITYYNRYQDNEAKNETDAYRSIEAGYQSWLFVGKESPCEKSIGVLCRRTVGYSKHMCKTRLPTVLAAVMNHGLPVREEFDEREHGEGPKKDIYMAQGIDIVLQLLSFVEDELAGVHVNTIEGFAWFSCLHDCLPTALFQAQTDDTENAETFESMLTTRLTGWRETVFPNFGSENLSFKPNGALQYGMSVTQLQQQGLIVSAVKNPCKKLSLLRKEVETKITNFLGGLDND